MAVFTKNIKLEFLSASDKIEKWAEPINDNLIKIDALGTEIVAAMLPFASLREAIEKNAGTNVDSTSIFFPDNISLPDVGDGVKRKLTDVVAQIANNKMSVDKPTVRTGTMKLLSGSSSMPAIQFGTQYDAYISGGNLVFAKAGVVSMTLSGQGASVTQTNEFSNDSVVNVGFLKSKGLQPQWIGAGLKYTGSPSQYFEVVGNRLKAIRVDATNGVEMTWDNLVRQSVIKLSDFMVIQDQATKEFKVTTKEEFLGSLIKNNYSAKYDPTTGNVTGDVLNTTLNPAGPYVPDGNSPGNVEYVIQKNGTFGGKPVYAGQTVYWDVAQSEWKLKAEYVRLTSFTGADGVTIVGDMAAGYGQYNADLIQFNTTGLEAIDPTSVQSQSAIRDLDKNKFNKSGGVIAGDITVNDINVQAGNKITIPTAPVNSTDAINKIYADQKFALLLGDKTKLFRVASPVGDDDAVPKKWVNTLVSGTVSGYYTKIESDNLYALKAGSVSQNFAVAEPIAGEHAVNKKFVVDGFASKQGDDTLTFKSAQPISDTDVVNKKYLEENVISGQSAGKGLMFTPGSSGVAPKIDVDIVDKMGLGFDAPDDSGKLMIDYPSLDRTTSVKPGDFLMVYDAISGQILKVNKDDFLGTLTQSLRLRGQWNPVTNVITGDVLNSSLISGTITINTFSKTQQYAAGQFVYYAPLQPDWNQANAYSKGDKVTYMTMDYIANDNIPANTALVEGTSGATWTYIDLYETYRANSAITPGNFDATKWTKVAYSGTGPVGLDGDNTSGFAYQVAVDGQYDLNGDGNITALLAGDQIVWTGSAWILVPDAQAVKQVFGRVGPVIAAAGDYKAEQIQYIRATGKSDIQAATDEVLRAINELDDRKVSTTRTQTISGNKTFQALTTFTVAPKVPQKPLTPADDDLITKAYVSKVLLDSEYITRVYSTTAGKPVAWTLGQQSIGLVGSTLNASAESEISLDGIQKLTVKGGSSIETQDNSKIILGNQSTLDTDTVLQHFKGKFDLQSTASMDASGKINIKYVPTDDDDAVPKKWVEDKILAAQTGYTKAEADAKFYLLTGGDVDGWGQFKQTATQSWALRLKSTSGVDGIFMSTTAADVSAISNGLSKPIIQTTASSVRIASVGRPIFLDGHCEATYGARLKNTQLFSTMGTLQVAGDQQMAFTNKIIGGQLHAGLWGHSLANPHNKTSADLVEDDSFLLNSDTWTLRGKRFEINTVQGAHCAVVPTEDTHLVNKKFLGDKAFIDAGPVDGKSYIRKNAAWAELVITAPTYWALPDLPQQLKDIVADATAAGVDAGEQKFYKIVNFHAKTVGGSAFKIYSGDRAAKGNELLDFRANQITEGEIRASKELKLSSTGDLSLVQFSSLSNLRLSQYGEVNIAIVGNNNKNININHDSGDQTRTSYTNVILKGGKGGTDVRGFKLLGNDAGTAQLEFNPGHTILDGQVGKQMQLIPENKPSDAFYYDSTNTRWNFRKLPRMATDTLNITPTQPEEFITKKYLDSVTSSLGVAAGLEGQVYTMGASTWAGQYPQYMGAVKESISKNRIKIDGDGAAGGRLLIQGSSELMGDANQAKRIDVVLEGTGAENASQQRHILINNRSGAGQIDIQSRGQVSLKQFTADSLLSGNSVQVQATGVSLPVKLSADEIKFAQRVNPASELTLLTGGPIQMSEFPSITAGNMSLHPQNSDTIYWSQLGLPAARGGCFWDELAVVGLHSAHNVGVQLQAVPSAEWTDTAIPAYMKRSNRKGNISLRIPKLSGATAVQPAGTSNGIIIQTENDNGGVYIQSKGTNGTINVQTGAVDYAGILTTTTVNNNQNLKVGLGGHFMVKTAGALSVQSNTGVNLWNSNRAGQWNGITIDVTTTAQMAFHGIAPAAGGHTLIRPGSHGGYTGNSVQIGAPNAGANRFAGLFIRGLDVGEGGTLDTANASTGRGLALVGQTPKWAAAQTATISDHYPRGGVLIGVRGDGAETASDSRHVQIINDSKLGRIDILAVPNAASINDSTINIIQGKGVTSSTANGIYIRSATKVEISGAQVEVKNLVTPVAGTDAANKDYVDTRIIISAADPLPTDGVDGQIWFKYE